MKKLIITLGSVLGGIVLILASLVFYANHQANKLYQEEQARIENLKSSQEKINSEFYQNQKDKANELNTLQENSNREETDFSKIIEQQAKTYQQIEQSKSFQDQDGDGLTLQEEEQMGTNDETRDSDLDGVPDAEDAHPAGGGQNYKLEVNWEHNGKQYKTQFGIPYDKYVWYQQQPREWCCDTWPKFVTYTDTAVQMIAEDIIDNARTQGETCLLCAAIDFVNSMTYQYDIDFNANAEYPKYPIETIIDQRGDCEDTSFLMASVFKALNIDAVILLLPGHAAVGVACDDCYGTYYPYNGKKFFYLETTGDPGQWEVGEVPPQFEGVSPEILEIP